MAQEFKIKGCCIPIQGLKFPTKQLKVEFTPTSSNSS